MADLKKEFNYFVENQSELVRLYGGKFIVIVGEDVVGAYDTALDAYDAVKSDYEKGTYLIQECTEGVESYTQAFHSRVAFV